jgi:alanyl-tRNA synthetase
LQLNETVVLSACKKISSLFKDQTMKTVAQIRQEFLDFFKERQHEIVGSAPVVPKDDPTLLFTNAGMNQFKDVFLGTGTRAYTRAADTQKCIRAGGKHNDLEEVGRDTYHHTFFEMLGSWSFGDYYKKDAIVWAWELLTDVWGLDKSRLYITVYRTDDEAIDLWTKETDIDPSHVLPFDEKDNFWEMADTGPCGPCSEIHFDLGSGPGDDPEVDPRTLVNAGTDRVIEIWNLVFIQFERQADGSLLDLPSKHVDTGMGLERVTAVLQNKRSNYDTDLFMPLIEAIADLTKVQYDPGAEGRRHRAVADHLRALSFSIADGASIGSNGRDYVLRRILRRASRFLSELGMNEPCLYKLVPVLSEQLGNVFPELPAQLDHVMAVIEAEEKLFVRTLNRGLKRFSKVIQKLAEENKTVIDGDAAFDLHQTYGFLIDLTEQMAEENGLTVNTDGFQKRLKAEQQQGRRTQTFNTANLGRFSLVQATQFVGYDTEIVGNALVVSATDTEIVLDKTPFYPESGGPKGDRGLIASIDQSGFEFRVDDTQKLGDVIVHRGQFLNGGSEKVGGPVEASVDQGYRSAIRRNHTGTHILHWALRSVLGDKVTQQGSVIKLDGFTFDFTHGESLSQAALNEIERLINERIIANDLVATDACDFETAKERGAMALFGEKYGDEVRVLAIGNGYSTELCGGIHVQATGEIGSLKILKESSVSAGVRRIEAVTGAFAVENALTNHQVVSQLSTDLKVPPTEILPRIAELFKQIKTLKKEAMKASKASVSPKDLLQKSQDINGIKVLVTMIDGDASAMRPVGDAIRSQTSPTIAVLFAKGKKGVALLCACTKDLVGQGWNCGDLIRSVTKILGGGGGGRPDFAEGKGKDAEKIDEAIAAILASIKEKAGA